MPDTALSPASLGHLEILPARSSTMCERTASGMMRLQFEQVSGTGTSKRPVGSITTTSSSGTTAAHAEVVAADVGAGGEGHLVDLAGQSIVREGGADHVDDRVPEVGRSSTSNFRVRHAGSESSRKWAGVAEVVEVGVGAAQVGSALLVMGVHPCMDDEAGHTRIVARAFRARSSRAGRSSRTTRIARLSRERSTAGPACPAGSLGSSSWTALAVVGRRWRPPGCPSGDSSTRHEGHGCCSRRVSHKPGGVRRV
jgi:hypothetical protein